MTMTANKVHENSPNIKVTMNYGPIQANCEEDHHHLRGFHTQLGQLLDEMEAAAKAKAEANG